MRFEPNRGQTDPQVKFLSRGLGYTLFITRDGVVLALPGSAPAEKAPLPDRERVRGAALAAVSKRRDAGVRVRSPYNSFSKVPHLPVTALAEKNRKSHAGRPLPNRERSAKPERAKDLARAARATRGGPG